MSLCYQLATEIIDAGRVATGPCQAGDETECDGVLSYAKDNGNRGGCRLSRQCCECLPTDETITFTRRSTNSAASVRKRSIGCPHTDILSRRSGPRRTLFRPDPGETRAPRGGAGPAVLLWRKPDHRQGRLLPARCGGQRPPRRRTTDELPSSHGPPQVRPDIARLNANTLAGGMKRMSALGQKRI